MRIYMAIITPGVALQWLGNGAYPTGTVLPNVRRIERLIEDILRGYWYPGGSPIILHEDGRIIDGVCRLVAIADSRATVRNLVVDGVDPEKFQFRDGAELLLKEVETIARPKKGILRDGGIRLLAILRNKLGPLQEDGHHGNTTPQES